MMLVCVLYSVSLIFQSTEMLQYWFQAKLMSKYVAVMSLSAYVVVSAYRCFLLVTQKSVFWFALSQALDYFLISVCLYIIYRKKSHQKLTVSFLLAKQLFQRSRYYIVSGIMVTLFSLTDRVMITLMLGKAANGFYSAAVTCASLSQFVFAAIIDSMRPSILETKKSNDTLHYHEYISLLYSIIMYLAIVQNVLLTIASPLVIKLLNLFDSQPDTLIIPDMPFESFEKKLYSTYLSYLPREKTISALKMNIDSRGSFTELLKTVNCGQFSVNISKPGITKGQHWHNSKWEIFIVVSGRALIQERCIGSDEILNFEVSGDNIEAVRMLPGYTHNIINLSDSEDLITLMWANEQFDPSHPDTFGEAVE